MPVSPLDRPIEALRQDVIDQLIMNYSHGVLSVDAFERRLDEAMEATEHAELLALTEDLELTVDQQFTETKARQFSAPAASSDEDGDTEYMLQVFGGSDRTGNWTVPKNIRVVSVFSGGTIDMSEAHFVHPVTRIKVFSLFAGDDILVPEGINVQTRVFCIFAGLDNSANSAADPDAPTVIIEGVAIFSGLDVKIKRTLKERFMRLADRMKNMWA